MLETLKIIEKYLEKAEYNIFVEIESSEFTADLLKIKEDLAALNVIEITIKSKDEHNKSLEKYEEDLFDLPISTRTLNCLYRLGLKTVGDVVNFFGIDTLKSNDFIVNPERKYRTRNFGRKSRWELVRELKEIGVIQK